MKHLICALTLGLLVSACGGSDNSPTAPPAATPTASLTTSGTGQWVTCLGTLGCNFQGDARNVGAGCAGTVRGVTRFYDAAGTQVGVGQWGLGSRVIRPNEAFLYSTIERFANTSITAYLTEPTWTNVTC